MRGHVEITVLLIAALFIGAVRTEAQQAGSQSSSSGVSAPQSMNDAWFTGPMLAPNANTLPRGHLLIEPYLYDVMGAHSNGFGNLTYINYGLVDKLTVGLIPTAGFNKLSNGRDSSKVELGDLTVQAQYRLAKFHEGSWIPSVSFNVQETVPTGKYDRLSRLSDGFGSGAYTTTLGLYSQTYLWLPNGRILRMRFNLSQVFSNEVSVKDVSVYGTGAGFRGLARPGESFLVDAAWEYSLTRRWVLATDATYRHNGNTRTRGFDILAPSGGHSLTGVELNSGSSDALGFAPAIEYSWSPNIGVLLGTRVIPPGHNTHATVTPAVAINYVR